jgi:signal recognition particle GTPase
LFFFLSAKEKAASSSSLVRIMGAGLSKTLARLFGNKEMRILMLGLDAAGKTSNLGFTIL